MTRFLGLVAVVAVICAAADPASAGWRRNCGCRGQSYRSAGSGQNGNWQTYTNSPGYYNGTVNTVAQPAPQSVTAGYPPTANDAPVPVQAESVQPTQAPPAAPQPNP